MRNAGSTGQRHPQRDGPNAEPPVGFASTGFDPLTRPVFARHDAPNQCESAVSYVATALWKFITGRNPAG